MKRLLSLMLSAAMVFGMLPISAFADETSVEATEASTQSTGADADQSAEDVQSVDENIQEQADDSEDMAPSASQETPVQDEGEDAQTSVQGTADVNSQDDAIADGSASISALSASDFPVLLATVSQLDEDASVSMAAVTQDGIRLADGVTVNQAQLAALQSASAAGTYPLTFYVGDDSAVVTVTVYSEVNAEAVSTVTDGNVTVNISEYDETQGWINGDVKDIEITVDFADTASANKTVSITLPEGIKYMKYPVVATDFNASSSLQLVDNTIFKEFMTSIASYPEKPSHGYDYGSFNETLAYTFRESTEKITFTIKVAVDESVYYGPKTFDGDRPS